MSFLSHHSHLLIQWLQKQYFSTILNHKESQVLKTNKNRNSPRNRFISGIEIDSQVLKFKNQSTEKKVTLVAITKEIISSSCKNSQKIRQRHLHIDHSQHFFIQSRLYPKSLQNAVSWIIFHIVHSHKQQNNRRSKSYSTQQTSKNQNQITPFRVFTLSWAIEIIVPSFNKVMITIGKEKVIGTSPQ